MIQATSFGSLVGTSSLFISSSRHVVPGEHFRNARAVEKHWLRSSPGLQEQEFVALHQTSSPGKSPVFDLDMSIFLDNHPQC